MKKVFLYSLSLLFLVLTSCSDLIDVQPRTAIDSSTALTTEEALDATLVGAYDGLQTTNIYGRDLIAIPEALADNGRATNKSGRLVPEFQNQPNAHMVNTWASAYFVINQVNLVLDAVGTAKISDAKKASVEGQAAFLRGLMYFELMKVYAYFPKNVIDAQNRGGVPLITGGVLDLKQINYGPRPTIDDCYKQIVADFTRAIDKLAATAATRAPFYATKGAAQGLLSRVYLYMGDWVNAEKLATDALASGIGKFQTTPATTLSAWRSAIHPESMFELNYQTNENVGVNTSLQTSYTTLVELGNTAKTGGFGDLVPTANLLTLMESEKDSTAKILDIRRSLYEKGTAGRGTAEIECTKFFGKNGAVNLDNVPVIRVSELYLNRAEALYNQGGKEAAALADLNAIRTHAGLPAKPATLTGAALLTEILNQRRLELAFEGHRFFDLKRLGRDLVKATTIPFTDYRILAPLPVREIQTNANLKQNFGY